LAENGPA